MIWMEGFDGPGTIAALNTKLSFSRTTDLSLVSALRGTGSALKNTPTATTDTYFRVTFSPYVETLYFHMKFKYDKPSTNSVASIYFMRFFKTTNVQGDIRFINGTSLNIYAVTSPVASIPFNVGQTYSFCGSLQAANSGHMNLYLDSTQVLNLNADFQYLAGSGISDVDVYLGDYANSTTRNDLTIDHLIFSDSPIPDCILDTSRPVAAGTYSDFTPSVGADTYAMVDESTLDESDYNSAVAIYSTDSYLLSEATENRAIKAVGVESYLKGSADSSRTIAGFKRYGGVDSSNIPPTTLSGTPSIISGYFETNIPKSAIELTGTGRAEFGIKADT